MVATVDRTPRIGVIGGSGLYDLELLEQVETIAVRTPYGQPSGDITVGNLLGVRIAFLPRHGTGHRLSPSEVPARANIHALRELGVRQIIAISAVGSLTERFAPGTLVVPDQLVDRTKGVRPATFFGGGAVAHVSMADPFCERLRADLGTAGKTAGYDLADGATYCCIEGPQFSTRAESHLYRSWGLDIIGMTAVPEAALAREAQLCYAGLALVTDYDCWHESEEAVTAGMVAETMRANVRAAREVLKEAVTTIDRTADCTCHHALTGAVLTDPAIIDAATRERCGLPVR
ncbi:S-methyl-5'-thioadenosine phosphorylase [Actinoplanes sp. N902-109]|uniref:S-methyl-5'-thioadenosine phosphorylase n=1 Tax=Actinoplanes sp. (strain N902-109) TaxID=649831 RepID=UPI00032954D0|nr:S-methyl-5'-thioadenosine phosphorylase [Actinoplanes sp. N902-109]AGL15334.1 5'-fluoro-5'-deoxy-adenosine phosphorylase (PNPase) [Actinoplanes sp. N902-109]